MTTLGDDAAAWIGSGDGLLPVIAALFLVVVVTVAIMGVSKGIWNSVGRS